MRRLIVRNLFFLHMLLIFSGLLYVPHSVNGEDVNPGADSSLGASTTQATPATPATWDAANTAAEENPSPVKTKKKKSYRKSRLTTDFSEETADKRRMLLTTGEDKAVDLDFEANGGANGIIIGNPQVVVTTLVKIGEKRQLVFKPLKAGETTVTVRDADGGLRLIFTVRVTGSNLLRIAGEIRTLLRDVEGLEIRVVGPKVILEGEVLVPGDYGRLLTVIQDKAYLDYVINLAILSPIAMAVLAKKIESDIHNANMADVRTRLVNGMIFLEGTVEKEADRSKAGSIASLYLPDLRPGSQLEKDPTVQRMQARSLVQNFIIVNAPLPKKAEKLIRITVHFVELSKDYSQLFGFKWQPGFTADPSISVGTNQTGAAGATAGSGLSFAGTISSLIPRLNSLQVAGYARILKTGTTIVRSGQPAKIIEQTQYPYAVQGANGQVSAAKETVGLSVAVTPMVLGKTDDIQMDLNIDQTDLVGRAPAAGAQPVTAVHRIETKVYIKSNESAAVGGVMSSQVGTDFNKDDPNPGSFQGTTTPLFSLLRTKNYNKKKSQYVVFVTPQIIEKASDGTEDLKKNFRIKVK